MATTRPGRAAGQREYSGGAVLVTAAAGILLFLVGLFHVAQGWIALVNDEFYFVGQEYVFEFNLTTWGWIHVIAGIIVALAGIGLFSGATWARAVAVVLASVSILVSFLWMPYYPVWSLTVIAFDIFVIWAVIAHGRDIARAGGTT